jgi:hypothetical protein
MLRRDHSWIASATNCMITRSMIKHVIQYGPADYDAEWEVFDHETYDAAYQLRDSADFRLSEMTTLACPF